MDFARWSVGQLSVDSNKTQMRSKGQVWAAGSRWLRFFIGPGKRIDITRLVHRILRIEHPADHQRIIMRKSVSNTASGKSLLTTWAESFIFAGSSALLLLIANLFPHWWYFSFFALTPVLYRIIKAAPGESLRLGFLLGLSFFGASLVNSLMISPLSSVLKLLSGTALFALFGWSVGWARERWGFYPSIVAVLWVGLEMGLVKLGFAGGLLGEAGFSQPFLHSLVGLFGFLTISAIIVLLNSLLVLAIVKTLEMTRPRGKTVAEDERILELFFIPGLSAQKVYLVPESRAPPFVPKTVCVRV